MVLPLTALICAALSATDTTAPDPVPPNPAREEVARAADEPRAPATDFVRGFHGIASLGVEAWPGIIQSSPFSPFAITTLRARPRFGLEVGPVPVVLGVDAEASYSFAVLVLNSDPPPYAWGDLDVSVASPGAWHTPDARWSLTPVVLGSIPLHASPLALITHLGGAVRGEYDNGRLRLGVTAAGHRNIWPALEEPTGRTDASGNTIYVCRVGPEAVCALSRVLPLGEASLSGRGEVWLSREVSVAASLGLSHTFRRDDLPVGDLSGLHFNYVSDYLHAGVDATYRIHRFVGASVSATILRPIIGRASGAIVIADSATWLGVSLFVRTNETLEPAWLTP